MRGERGCNLVYHSYDTQEGQNIMCGGPRSLHTHTMHNSNNNDDSNTHVTLTITIEIIICTTDDDERYPGATSVVHFPFYFFFLRFVLFSFSHPKRKKRLYSRTSIEIESDRYILRIDIKSTKYGILNLHSDYYMHGRIHRGSFPGSPFPSKCFYIFFAFIPGTYVFLLNHPQNYKNLYMYIIL